MPSWLSLSGNAGTVAPGDSTEIVVTMNNPLHPKGDYATRLAIVSNDSASGTQYIDVRLHVGTRLYAPTSVTNFWNLLSIPVVPVSYARSDLFPTSVGSAFAFEGAYIVRETLKVGEGYWMRFTSPQTISIDGYVLTEDTIEVAEGWNLIGSITSAVAVSSIASNPGGIATSEFFGYNGMYRSADSIQPGRAYWVKVDQGGQLILSSSSAASPSAAIQIRPSRERPPSPPAGGEPEGAQQPGSFALEQNYPNPFNPVTTIRYALPQEAFVILKIYDMLGREVATLVQEDQPAGYRSVEFDAGRLPSGVYTYRIAAASFTEVKKMLLIK